MHVFFVSHVSVSARNNTGKDTENYMWITCDSIYFAANLYKIVKQFKRNTPTT